MPKDPQVLQMKTKAERSPFFFALCGNSNSGTLPSKILPQIVEKQGRTLAILFLSVALELSFRMFLNASVKDFSYFLGSVGGFGGDFGVILV